MRACLLASARARRLGVDEATAADIYYTTLLRSVGCTAPAHEQAWLAGGDDIALRAGRARIDSARRREVFGFMVSHIGRGQSPWHRARQLGKAVSYPWLERQVKATGDEQKQQDLMKQLLDIAADKDVNLDAFNKGSVKACRTRARSTR